MKTTRSARGDWVSRPAKELSGVCLRLALTGVLYALLALGPVLAWTPSLAGQTVSTPSVSPSANPRRAQPASSMHDSNADSTASRARKNYLVPALEIVGFDALLNLVDRQIYGADYKVTAATIRHNLKGSWVIDNDPFSINQFMHPYQGSMYHGFARSAGLNYWQALGYTFIGSALWEVAGETTPPSRNDQLASGVAGSFFGEPLFRIAHLLLSSDSGGPRIWRRVVASAIAPTMGFNRLAFGHRYDDNFSSHDPEYYRRLQLGASTGVQNARGTSTSLIPNEAMAELAVEYGLPGKPGYEYRRPFDYFSAQATASSANGIESIVTRGLLVGRKYGARDMYRGLWGLFGSYDYIAPQIFRVSSTALSLGTTGQWLYKNAALQGTAMAGGGYVAAGTIHGTGDRDYHYGVAPQALLASRLILGDRVSIDATGREYFVSHVAAAGTQGHDNIARAEASLTVRVLKQEALTVKYLWTRRDAVYPGVGRNTQVRGTAGVYFTFLGSDRFGVVDWRR